MRDDMAVALLIIMVLTGFVIIMVDDYVDSQYTPNVPSEAHPPQPQK